VSNGPAMIRVLLEREIPSIAPLVLDPLDAKTAESVGFEILYVGGGAMGFVKTFSEANISLQEMADAAVNIRSACNLPLILDGTCGWGEPMHLHHTIALAEASGYAAIEIEDQLVPKRVHHHIGIEHLIPTEMMMHKIEEAVAARKDENFVIIARTNACRTNDLDSALRRAEAYKSAGADMLLLLPKTADQAEEIGLRIEGPLCFMTLAGIRSMGMSLAEAGQLGYKLIVEGRTPLLARQRALRLCYEAIARGEADPTFHDLYDEEQQQLHDLLDLEYLLAIERRTVENA
jgi:2-methylisocitrate lyase-like PEP mutase family enzyme